VNRLQSICEVGANLNCDAGETIATYHYKGPSRLEKRTYGPDGTPISKMEPTYDNLPRLIDMNHTTGAGAQIARFQYGHDRESHRLFEKRVHDGNQGDAYRYDSIYRVTRNPQNVDLSAVAPGTEIDPDSYATAPNRLEYTLDGVGNRTTTTQVVSGTPTVTTYSQTPDGSLKDAEVNQYTTTQEAAQPVRNYTYDLNGNMTSDGSRTYAYDFKNHLVEVRDQMTNNLIAQYSYDALDRRIKKTLAGGSTIYLFDGNQVIEERDSTNAITRQYVWGKSLGELLQESTPTSILYAHENAIGSIAALTNPAGVTVERYRYDPFGNTTLPLNGGIGNQYRFQSLYFDAETGCYFARNRTYSPALGRYLQRDPIGTWGDPSNIGNGYIFAGNDAINGTDPFGLFDTRNVWRKLTEKEKGVWYGLKADGWQLQVQIPSSGWTWWGGQGPPVPGIAKNNFHANPLEISLDVKDDDFVGALAAGRDVQWIDDKWAVDFTLKAIYIDAYRDDSALEYIRYIFGKLADWQEGEFEGTLRGTDVGRGAINAELKKTERDLSPSEKRLYHQLAALRSDQAAKVINSLKDVAQVENPAQAAKAIAKLLIETFKANKTTQEAENLEKLLDKDLLP
jgi:RHS repeat-associated protein